MTHIPIQLPFRGFTEQNQFSSVPAGMTPSCLNMMPSDVWSGRMRISTRNGTRKWRTAEGAEIDNIQFIGSYRIYASGVLTENLIIVSNGLVYYGNPKADNASFTLFSNQGTAKLASNRMVEGVQFNDHFYFVDGTNYAFAHLSDPTGGSGGVAQWGAAGSPASGPYHTDSTAAATSGAGKRATTICRWGARLVIAGFSDKPNLWFACDVDAPYPNAGTDGWNGNDRIGAIGGSSGNNYGTIGDPIVAVTPFGDQGLLFACSNSFSYLTGDPVLAGSNSVQMAVLTNSIGIAGRRAMCFGQERSLYVLAKDGLYYLTPNDFNFNRGNRISAGRLDSFFLRLDFGSTASGGSTILSGGTLRSIGNPTGSATTILDSNSEIITDIPYATVSGGAVAVAASSETPAGEIWPVLHWDSEREGVWIFLSVSGFPKSSLHLFYDVKTDSFWPQRFADPLCAGPTSAFFIGESRSKSGRLILGSDDALAIMDQSFPVGIDGFIASMTDREQEAQWVRSSLVLGPMIAPLPYRLQLNEVRVDLNEDNYELPSGFTDLSNPPVISVATGDTAQQAIGLREDSLFISNIRVVEVDCEDSSQPVSVVTYDCGGASASPANVLDSRFAARPFGLFTKSDPFTSGTASVYAGPSSYTLSFSGNSWRIKWNSETEYLKDDQEQNPNGLYSDQISNPIAPEVADGALVSGASFSESTVSEIGNLTTGRNEAIKARIRSEAMYFSIASDGRPWSIERMSVLASQVGISRGAT